VKFVMSSQEEEIMVKTGKVKVNDINMYYEIHGDGFPLVMIMGLAANVDWWPPEFLEEIPKEFKTIIFDNRGAGRTDKPDIEYSIKIFADDTVGLMDALNIKKAHLLGISMGGMIAQEIVLNYPERVEKLVLCATHCGGAKYILPSPEIMEILMKGTEGMTPEEGTELMISLIFTEDFIKNNPDYIERTRENILKEYIPDFSYQRQIGAAMKFNSGRRLKKVKTPTLIVQGRKDVLVQPQNADLLAKLIPGSRVAYFDNSGHAVHSQETEIVNKTILEFLE
jgi:pimeloyl-ACP methyl ester carboxylesterase